MYYKEDNHFVEATKVRSRVKNLSHEIFLDESISEPEYYRSVISLLRNGVMEGDDVEIYISNGGGLAHTASAITDAMAMCKGNLIGYLSGQVCSAATRIALKCDDWVVGEDICWMIHSCSYGLAGKESDISNQQEFMTKWSDKFFRDTYSGFLSEDEIETALKYGKEYWFSSDETHERLKNFHAYRAGKQTQAMQSMFDEQIAQEDEALEAGLQHLLKQGKATPEEIAVIKKLTPLLDEAFDKGEIDFENLGSACEVASVEELIITDVNGNVYEVSFECSAEDSGDVHLFDIEVCSEDNAFFIDSEDLFDGYGLDALKHIANLFSIPYVHNIGAKRLAARIEEYFVELINEHLQK